MSGWMRATRINSSSMQPNSVLSDLRKLRRAGTLKKRLRTDMLVPLAVVVGLCSFTSPPSISTTVPVSSSARLVFSSTWAIAAMEARASPLNPLV